MATAVLGVRQRGSQQFSQVVRMAGPTTVAVGNNFSIMTLTAATGTAQVGDTLRGSSSLATCIVTQVLTAGATTKLCVNTVTGIFTTEAVTTIAGSGNLAGSLAVANIGILEFTSNANTNCPSNRVVSFKGSLYCVLNNYILKYDGTANWSVVFTYPNFLTSIETDCHTGLHIFYVNNAPLMGVVWGGASGQNSMFRATTTDGTSWSSVNIATSKGINGNTGGVQREVVWNNVLYFIASWNNGGFAHAQWNPADDSFQQVALPSGMGARNCMDIYVDDDRLLILTINSGNGHATIWSFLAGAYTQVLDFTDTGNTQGGGGSNNTTQWTFFDMGDGFLYCIYFAFTNAPVGWVVKKVSFSGGVYTDLGQIQSTILAGTGIPIYPSGPDIETGHWHVVVDDVTVPGTPATYLYFIPNDLAGTAIVALQWTEPQTSIAVGSNGASLPQATINVASTSGFPASGNLTIETVANGNQTVAYTGTSGGNQFTGCTLGTGLLATGKRVYGTAQALTNLGTGGAAEVALAHTRAGGGERIWSPGQPDIIITNIVSTTGGEQISFIGYGGGTKTVQFWYSQINEAPKLQATLIAPVTGGGTLDAPNKQILTCPMDGTTVQTVVWNTIADNVSNFTRTQVQPIAF